MSEPLFVSLSDAELAEQGQNSLFLKEQALELIQDLSSQDWNDHNAADPGITLLEVLSFAISDLSYRLSFSVPELLSPDLHRTQWEPTPFYLSPEILPSNMVTNTDIRQAIIDVPGVKNAMVLPGKQLLPDGSGSFPISAVQLLVELQAEYAAPSSSLSSALPPALAAQEQHALLTQVRERFLSLRNVNQDLLAVHVLASQSIAVRLALGFENINNPIEKAAEVLNACRHVISPDIHRYTLQALQEQGLSDDDIFSGPLSTNGFVQQEALNNTILPEWIFTSDVLKVMQVIDGLEDINGFRFISADQSVANSADEKSYWRIQIEQGKVATFDVDLSLDLLELSIDGQPFILDTEARERIKALISEDRVLADAAHTPQVSDYIGDRYRKLHHYESIQQDFPEVYQLNEQRIDTATDLSAYTQILQLKGFLTLFDQVLADETAQLDNLRKLLAIPDNTVYPRLVRVFNAMLASESLSTRTIKQFWQDVRQLPQSQLSQSIINSNVSVSGIQHLLHDYFSTYQQQGFQAYAEPILSDTQLTRLTHSLEHLLARFSERHVDAGLLKYRPVFAHYLEDFQPIPDDISQESPLLDKLVALKSLLDLAAILTEYPVISRQRAGGANYLSLASSRTQPSGLLQRVARFLGLSHIGEMPLAVGNRESLYLLESELLRHGADAENYHANQLYFVMPDWPTRFSNTEFLSLLTEQLRQQSPVHQQVFLIPLSRSLMSLFERVYFCWLNAMTQKALPVISSAANTSIPQSAHEDNFINVLSAYLRDFVVAPDKLLEQILTTMIDAEQQNPWQELLDNIHLWLGIDPALDDIINGDDYAIIHQQLNNFLSEQTIYGNVDADSVLFAIAHQYLSRQFNPNPISDAVIGHNFRIGYQPLEYLQPSHPITTAYINLGSEGKPNFITSINAPRTI